jgi:hypothetical protein
MKLDQTHYAHMQKAISNIWTKEKHDCHRKFIINEGKAKDVEKRLRWDWFYYADLAGWTSDNLPNDLDQSHIDTALRKITQALAS